MRRVLRRECGDEEDAIASSEPGAGSPRGGADRSGTRPRAVAPDDLGPCRTPDDVFRRYGAFTFRLIHKRVYDAAAAEDLCQNVLVTVGRKIRWDGVAAEDAVRLIPSLVDGAIKNHVQALRRHPEEPTSDCDTGPSSWPDPEQALIERRRQESMRDGIRDVLSEIPPLQRTLLELSREDLTPAEIGETVGRPDTIHTDLYRARKAFREASRPFAEIFNELRRKR